MNEKNQLIVIALDKWGKVPESLELVEIVLKLEEENRKLKSDYDRLDKVASENVRTLDELDAEIIELKENRSIEIKTCNRYREKCEEYSKQITQLKIDLSNAESRARSWEAVAR